MRVRQLYLWHRYLGVALCLLFLMWFVSGIVMLYVRMPILFPEERLSLLAPVTPDAVVLTPAQAVERAGLSEAPRRIRLAMLEGRPIYYVLPRSRPWIGVFADTGDLLGTVGPGTAVAITKQTTGTGDAQYVGTVSEIDQWTLTNSLNLHRPLHRIRVDDEVATELYVSAMTGEVVMRSTGRERALAWLGPIVHWGAPEAIRARVGGWRQTMLWLSGGGIALTITGLWIGVLRYRWRGYALKNGRAKSPYRGWKQWHHWGGLVFGGVTLTWMVSGWLYLNPGGSRSGPLETITTMSPYNLGGIRADQSPTADQVLRLSGGRLDPQAFTIPFARAWSQISTVERPREVELVRVGGSSYYIAYAGWNRSWILSADHQEPPFEKFDAAMLVNLASRLMPGYRLLEVTSLDRYDAYYYAVGAVAPKRLPILRLKFDDPTETWFYIDPHTGSIFRRYDRYARAMRWAINGLHTLDFPLLFAHRPAWDLVVIGLSAGGIVLSITGLTIGWRRLEWPVRLRFAANRSATRGTSIVRAGAGDHRRQA
jgi:uncharacterized iron-regulated membrane protein